MELSTWGILGIIAAGSLAVGGIYAAYGCHLNRKSELYKSPQM